MGGLGGTVSFKKKTLDIHTSIASSLLKNIVERQKEKLAAGVLRDLYVEGNDQDIDNRDESDETVGRPWKIKSRKSYTLSISEENFISNLTSCISVHLVFHAMGNDMNGVIFLS